MFIFPAVLEDTVSLYTASGSYSLSSAKIPQSWKEGHDVDVSFRDVCFAFFYYLELGQLCISG